MMYIDKETKVWVNIDAHYKGFSKLDTPEIRARAGLIEVPDPTPPADYSEETYYRRETPDRAPPYVTFERKSDEQLEELRKFKLVAQIAALEAGQARAVREAALGDPTYLREIDAKIENLRKSLVRG